MDWFGRMKAAVDYIEDHITSDIDYKEVAKIACCPNYHFQRLFSFITDIPLSVYIKRRRLTLAAFELQQSSKSIIEIAMKYGYESHSTFTRAFSELHGIAPMAARKSGAKLKAYPRLSFQISITGGEELNYRIESIGMFEAIGYKYRVNTEQSYTRISAIWEEARCNGLPDRLLELAGHHASSNPGGLLGVCADGDWGRNDEFTYYIAVPSRKEAPEGMEKLVFPENQWVVFEAPTVYDILNNWKRLYTEWVPASGYSLAHMPAIESYYPPEHLPQNELWIPIVSGNV